MHTIRNAAIAFCLFVCNLQAQTIIQNSNLSFFAVTSSQPANYAFTVQQNPAGTNPTSAWFKIDQIAFISGTNFYNRLDVSLISLNADEGSDWYVVKPGDQFGPSTIAAGQFQKFFSAPTITVWTQALFSVPEDFYLGFSTGLGFSPTIAGKPNRTVYGWVHLHPLPFPDDSVVQMVGNAISYDGPGIIVGTTTLVPEPSTTAMFFCALACCVSGRFGRKNNSPSAHY